jgi:hypothetical protein
MYLKPAPGAQVPDPERGDLLPPDGREVQFTQYWQRRINDGDVTEDPAPASTTPATTPSISKPKKES